MTRTTAPGTGSYKAADFTSPWRKTNTEETDSVYNDYSQTPAVNEEFLMR